MARAEFSKKTKLAAWDHCDERCECYRLPNWKPTCNRDRIIGVAEYHHIIEASVGGSNELDNCAVLSPKCHALVTAKQSIPQVAKSVRVFEKRAGVRKSRPMPGSKASAWKKKMDGSTVRRG